jgi:hypothetical protein
MYPTFMAYVDAVKDGSFGKKFFVSGLANHGLVLTPINDIDKRVPADLQKQVDALVSQLAWSPVGAMLGALLFALFDSLALLAQSSSVGLPVEFFSSLPYAMTLLALMPHGTRAASSASLGATLRRVSCRRMQILAKPRPPFFGWLPCAASVQPRKPVASNSGWRHLKWEVSTGSSTSSDDVRLMSLLADSGPMVDTASRPVFAPQTPEQTATKRGPS